MVLSFGQEFWWCGLVEGFGVIPEVGGWWRGLAERFGGEVWDESREDFLGDGFREIVQ